MFELLPCQSRVSSTTELVELNCFAELQKFNSDAVLLSNFIPEFSSARQMHDVWTGPKEEP